MTATSPSASAVPELRSEPGGRREERSGRARPRNGSGYGRVGVSRSGTTCAFSRVEQAHVFRMLSRPMQLRFFFTIPSHGDDVVAEELNRFFAAQRILAGERQLVQDGGASACAVCVAVGFSCARAHNRSGCPEPEQTGLRGAGAVRAGAAPQLNGPRFVSGPRSRAANTPW